MNRRALLLTVTASLAACRFDLPLTEATDRPLPEEEARRLNSEQVEPVGNLRVITGQVSRKAVERISRWRLNVWMYVKNCTTGAPRGPLLSSIEGLPVDDFEGLSRLLANRTGQTSFSMTAIIASPGLGPSQCLQVYGGENWLYGFSGEIVPIRSISPMPGAQPSPGPLGQVAVRVVPQDE